MNRAYCRTLLAAAVASAAWTAACRDDEPKDVTGETTVESAPSAAQAAAPTAEPAVESPPPVMPAATEVDSVLTAAGVAFEVGADWVKETPKSSIRLAEYSLPGTAGPANMTMFCFGRGQGGTRQANIDRWVGQFHKPDKPEEPAEPQSDTWQQNGLTVTTVTATGTYSGDAAGSMSMVSEGTKDFSIFGVIVEDGPEGTVFVKVIGPAGTMTAQQEALTKFARSARTAGS